MEAINSIRLQQNLAQMMLIQKLQEASNDSSLTFKESGGIPDGYMPEDNQQQGPRNNADSDTDSGANQRQKRNRTDSQNRQQPGETARLTSKEDLASMPDKKENGETTLPETKPAMQNAYDSAQQMEAFRLQNERNRMMRKKPLGE